MEGVFMIVDLVH